jgi:hypothetical protein
MLRWVVYLFGLVAILAVPVARAAEAGIGSPLPGGDGGSPPSNLDLGFGIGAGSALFIVLISLVVWQWKSPPQIKDEDKAVEVLRIIYGFWLIVSALLVAFLVLTVTLISFHADRTGSPANIVAIIGTVTGLTTTLTAAFFGIQQAGAGRSQAITALSQLRLPGSDGVGSNRLVPSYGPHSGGTRVSITGNGFTGASAVNFGQTPGENFKLENDGLVSVNSPPAPPKVNEAKVFITFPSAHLPNREVGTFYYYTISPRQGEVGTPVKISGSGLKEVSIVRFGEKDGTDLSQLELDPNTGRDFREVKAPPGSTGTDVPVSLVYPVDSATNTSVIGSYQYIASTSSQ